ncbi:ABC transporter substrate-binding protein [Erysipelothrix larvae]|uniref:ABC transporter substrate-binding protein n=1 Tax=Erysipelothrix larvae TaxID=1514105 RepID=A0A0X8H1B4_9FIRM|nr:ABC transporter substrate-binding protein [Erysipelothrix larvae]AMC94190.1 ABC transporter substrate-binding protein [Erysipelothrix larvae]
MKKIFVGLVASLMVLVGCGSNSSGQEVLRVYNWGEYIDTDVISAFEEEYGVRVQYDTFTSNEEMYTKLLSGETYDVIVPSDYTIQRLREEGLLSKIDFSKITNYSNISDDYQDRHFDPNNEYSVPYFVGSVGIVYDTTKVDSSVVEAQGWEIFKNTDYNGQVFFYDSERDGFMVALKALGYSMNTENEQELNEAYEWLVEMKAATNPIFVTDTVIDGMIGGEKSIAVMYSGDATFVISENENLEYFEPKQGTNLWIDSMVIPEVSQNKDLAHKFIDFITREENSMANSVYVGYSSPIEAVVEELTAEGGEFEGISSYIPRADFDLDEEFFYNAVTKEIMGDLWIKVISQ